MSHGTGYVYHTLVLAYGTSRLLCRRGRVLDFRSKGLGFDPRPELEDFLKVRDR